MKHIKKTITTLSAVLLTTLIAGPVFAADPICDPSDPAYGTPYDPNSGSYLRKTKTIHFCAPRSTATAQITSQLACLVTVDGNPYALSSTVDEGTEHVVDVVEGAGTVAVECTGDVLAGDGASYTQVRDVTFTYVNTPVMEPPVPLED